MWRRQEYDPYEAMGASLYYEAIPQTWYSRPQVSPTYTSVPWGSSWLPWGSQPLQPPSPPYPQSWSPYTSSLWWGGPSLKPVYLPGYQQLPTPYRPYPVRPKKSVGQSDGSLKWGWVAAIIVFFLLVAAISVGVYFGVTASAGQSVGEESTVTLRVTLTDWTYQAALDDPSSAFFSSQASYVCQEFSDVLAGSVLASSYVGCQVDRFSAGSVTAHVNLTFTSDLADLTSLVKVTLRQAETAGRLFAANQLASILFDGELDLCNHPYYPRCQYTCTQTASTYACTCPAGYLLADNKVSCEDADECVLDSHDCSQRCVNTEGGFQCACDPGYSLEDDAKNCTDVDECASAACSQICNNTVGSFSCSCYHGYELAPDRATCDDIDECAKGNGGCSQLCINSEGSYNCSCRAGFELDGDGRNCSDLDECAKGNGGCSQMCINSEGSYNCSCHPGFELDGDGRNCSDINECSLNNGGCSQLCINSEGSYNCSCRAGFELDRDGRNCSVLCGVRTSTPSGAVALIVGGSDVTSPGKWPWQGQLVRTMSTDYSCGVTVISEQWLLTSAFCFKDDSNPSSYTVRLGTVDRTGSSDDLVSAQIEAIIIHEDYDKDNFLNDVAAVRLTSPLNMTDFVRPICLANENVTLNKDTCTTTGWGGPADKDLAAQLQEVGLSELAPADCNDKYYEIYSYVEVPLNDDQICAGDLDGAQGTCVSDSGGPLACQGTEDGVWYQAGITSWNLQCAYYSVFSRVTSYYSWITNVINR